MKKFLVIGNPVQHSLSPRLHNFWFKKNNINALYEKKEINEKDINLIISEIKDEKIFGANVTVPFKNKIIPFMDELSSEASQSQSVNTIYNKSGKLIGHNTDISGFELGIKYSKYDVKNKIVFILGAGGVVSSIIIALKRMGAAKLIIANRTQHKAENLKKIFNELEIIDWGETPAFDMIINATSIGLKNEDGIKLDYSKIEPNKFFYDVIYNPKETIFLKRAKLFGNKSENGKMMFIYQAHQSFTIWHSVMPSIDEETINLLDQ
tara:strand:- start:4 stop:798 length:795 start_codon:yes stop_codon:yes gene_type:complete